MIFDNDPAKIGTQVGTFTVKDIKSIKDTVHQAGIKVAMIATPSQTAQEVADELVSSGVKAILNYAFQSPDKQPSSPVQFQARRQKQ